MREIVFECKEPFEGSAKIELPKYTQRLKYIKECNFKVNADGEVDASTDQLDALMSMVEVAKKHISDVDIKCGEIHAKSFDDLEDFVEFDSLIPELASTVLNGGRVGNA